MCNYNDYVKFSHFHDDIPSTHVSRHISRHPSQQKFLQNTVKGRLENEHLKAVVWAHLLDRDLLHLETSFHGVLELYRVP